MQVIAGGFVGQLNTVDGLVGAAVTNPGSVGGAGVALALQILDGKALSKQVRAELADRGVEVLTVYPGAITSPLEAGARAGWGSSPWQTLMPSAAPDGLADAIVAAAQRGDARLMYPRPMRWLAPRVGVIRRVAARFGPRPVA